MEILLRSALILGIIVVVGTALFAGARLGELMERMAGAGFADDPEEAARAVDPPPVTGRDADDQHLTIGSVMGSTDVEARIAKPEPTHVENATSPPRVDGEIADSPAASSDSAAGGLDGREEFDLPLVPSPSGLPAAVVRPVDPSRVTGRGADTQHLTIGSVMGSTDVEARIVKPEPTHVENATSPPRVDGEIADSPAASSDSAAGGLDGREEFDLSLVPSPSGLPAAVVRAVASWDIAYARGHQAQLEGDVAAATQRYRQAAKLNPEHPAIHYDLGYVLQIQGDTDAAMEEYQKAIELNPDHPHAYYNLGFLLQKKGDEQSAVANYEKAASINPDNPYIHYNLGLIQEHRKDLASAEALYRKVIALAGDRRPGIDAQIRLAALRRVPCVSESH